MFDLSLDDLDEFDSIDDLPIIHPGVYVICDGDRPLYVGQSQNVQSRLMVHRREKKWFPQELRLLISPVLVTETARLLLETLLILRNHPPHNRMIKLGLNADGTLSELMFLRTRRKRSN